MEKKINIRLIFTLLLCRAVSSKFKYNEEEEKNLFFSRIYLEFRNISFNMSIFFDQ